jgi:hypothetical protein
VGGPVEVVNANARLRKWSKQKKKNRFNEDRLRFPVSKHQVLLDSIEQWVLETNAGKQLS